MPCWPRVSGLLLLLSGTAAASGQGWTINGASMQCEYLSRPAMGIETAYPRFSWFSNQPKDGAWALGSQESHFQLQVVDVDADKALVWDSGKVDSLVRRTDGPVTYDHDGKALPLRSARVYEWRVRSWITAAGNETTTLTPWSESARFVTGWLDVLGWEGAYWIGHPDPKLNLFRTEVPPAGQAVVRALLFVSGLGYHHVQVDGFPVTDAKLEPGYTGFTKRAFYSTYDITSFFLTNHSRRASSAGHVLTVELGNGYLHSWGGEPTGNRMLVAKLQILLADGSVWNAAASDDTWRCTQGPVVYDSVWIGEIFDSRVEASVRHADKYGYDVTSWAQAVPVAGPGGVLRSPNMPSVRPVKVLKPISVNEPRPGVFVFDFGQNTAAVCRLYLPVKELRGLVKSGDNVTLRHAETLQHAGIVEKPQPGMIYVDNLKTALCTDTYIFADLAELYSESDVIVYEPKFTYHGFRYAELTNLPPNVKPTLDWIVSLVQHTDVQSRGTQNFSHPILQGIHRNTLWSQTSNLMSVPTDCPQRDERKGYGGDAQLSAQEAIYNFEMTATYLKFLRDMALEMDDEGTIPDCTPFQMGLRPGDPSWTTAFPSITYYLYRDTGDKAIVREFYPQLLRYLGWLEGQYRLTGLANFTGHYGDWVNVGWPQNRLNGHLTASASFTENCVQMAALARAMGDEVQVKRFTSLADELRKEWHKAFYNESLGTYNNGEQTALGLALYLQAVPDNLLPKIEAQLVHDITVTNNGHQTAGIIGTLYMYEALSSVLGRTDVGLTIASAETYPSFGYMLVSPFEPATTLWELWDTDKEGPLMNSRNHIMFGAIDSWFHRYLIGIRPPEDLQQAGFKEVVLEPYMDPCMRGVLSAASGSTYTPNGLVELAWQWGLDDIYNVTATVPEGSLGRLQLKGMAGVGKVSVMTWNGVSPAQEELKELRAAQSLDLLSGRHTILAAVDMGAACSKRGA